jgi:hypothetical protein
MKSHERSRKIEIGLTSQKHFYCNLIGKDLRVYLVEDEDFPGQHCLKIDTINSNSYYPNSRSNLPDNCRVDERPNFRAPF